MRVSYAITAGAACYQGIAYLSSRSRNAYLRYEVDKYHIKGATNLRPIHAHLVILLPSAYDVHITRVVPSCGVYVSGNGVVITEDPAGSNKTRRNVVS
jgi:hypothetical protein